MNYEIKHCDADESRYGKTEMKTIDAVFTDKQAIAIANALNEHGIRIEIVGLG